MKAVLKTQNKEIALYFGMMAIEEIGTRQSTGMPGWFKLITDVIYGGYINEVNLCGAIPKYDYRAIAEIVDDLILDESPQLAEIFKSFEQSKAAEKLDSKKKTKTREKSAGTK